jgi:hypothetical protein
VSRRRPFTGAALLAAVCAVVAAGSGIGASASAGPRTRTATPAGTPTTTTSTLTQPTVTVAPTVQTTPSPAEPGYKRPTIVVGDMNTHEQFLLGALYSIALSQAG